MTNGLDFTATYTLAKAKSTIGTAADELNANNLQDATLLYDDPTRLRADVANRRAATPGSLAAVLLVKGFTISPIFLYRSPLPVSTTAGVDRNLNWREQRPAGSRVPVRRRRQPAEGHRPVRDLELRPRRVADPDEPARVASFTLTGRARVEAIAKSSTCSTRRTRRRSSPTDERALHAAERVLGRLPEPRAARRPDRLPVQLLRHEAREGESRSSR